MRTGHRTNSRLCAPGLRIPEDHLPPPPTDSNHPPPEVWCTVLERGHYYVVAAKTTSPGPWYEPEGFGYYHCWFWIPEPREQSPEVLWYLD